MVKDLLFECMDRYRAVWASVAHWVVYCVIFVIAAWMGSSQPVSMAIFMLLSGSYELVIRCDRQTRIVMYILVCLMLFLGSAIIRESGVIAAHEIQSKTTQH